MVDEVREGRMRDEITEDGAARFVGGSLERGGFAERESFVGAEGEADDELAWRRVRKGGLGRRLVDWAAVAWGRAESCRRRERKAAGGRCGTSGLDEVHVRGSCRRRKE